VSTNGHPSLTAEDLSRIAADEAYAGAIDRAESDDVAGWDFDDAPETPETARMHSWLGRSLPEDDQPLVPDIAGLLFRGLVHEFTGGSEAGKTMLLLSIAVDQARAGSHVVWVDFEMGPRLMKRRLRDGLGLTASEVHELVNDPTTRRLHYVRPDAPALDAQIADLIAAAPDVSVVVVDAMTGALELHGLGSNSDIDIDRIHRLLTTPFKDRNAAVVVIDHPGKDPEKGTKGSIRKEQAVDVRYLVKTVKAYAKGAGGSSRLIVTKDRTAELDRGLERLYILSVGTWTFETRDGAPTGLRKTTLMERLSRYLEALGEPLSRTQIFSRVEGREEDLADALDRLLAEGFAAEHEGPRHARLTASAREYRADQDPQSDTYRPPPTSSAPPPGAGASTSSAPPVLREEQEEDRQRGRSTDRPPPAHPEAHERAAIDLRADLLGDDERGDW
jgi:AAA domain